MVNLLPSRRELLQTIPQQIYKTDAEGTINHDEHNHPTNAKPIDFSITKSVVMIIITALLMFFLFKSLASSYVANKGVATGAGRFLNPSFFILETTLPFQTLEKKYMRYMPFLLTVFSLYGSKYFG